MPLPSWKEIATAQAAAFSIIFALPPLMLCSCVSQPRPPSEMELATARLRDRLEQSRRNHDAGMARIERSRAAFRASFDRYLEHVKTLPPEQRIESLQTMQRQLSDWQREDREQAAVDAQVRAADALEELTWTRR